MVTTLYWHIDCKADHDTCVNLGFEVRRMLSDLQACDECFAQAEQDWDGWQQLLDLTLKPTSFYPKRPDPASSWCYALVVVDGVEV